MITGIIWTDDSKLLQVSNLTAWQVRTAPITLYIQFNQRRRPANEGLVNLTEDTAPRHRCYTLLYGLPGGVQKLCMEQKFRSKCLPWPGLESRTSNLAVQPATARPPRTPIYPGSEY